MFKFYDFKQGLLMFAIFGFDDLFVFNRARNIFNKLHRTQVFVTRDFNKPSLASLPKSKKNIKIK